MAEKPTNSGPRLGLGMIFLLIFVGVFIIWILVGGPTNKNKTTTTTVEKSVWPANSDINSFGSPSN